jgi:hypothetical protein
MLYKFIFLTFLAGLSSSEVFGMDTADRDIYPPDPNGGNFGRWRWKNENRPAPGEKLVPYHAWIKDKDARPAANKSLIANYYVLDENGQGKKIYTFYCTEDGQGNPIDVTHYSFEKKDDEKFLLSAPYKNHKTGDIEGEKYDVYNLPGTVRQDEKKFWDKKPDYVPENFSIVFKYYESAQR